MSKEFISNTVLDARVFYSRQTTFSGGLQGIQLNQAGEVAAIAGRIAASPGVGGAGQGTVATIGQIVVLPDAGREPAYQGDVQATIGRVTVPTVGVGYAGDVATIIDEVSVGTWVRLGRQGGEAAATIDQTVVSVVADLTDLNRRDVSNTLEFASRYADGLVPMGEDSASWSWFRNFTSAIPQLGWTAHTTGYTKRKLQFPTNDIFYLGPRTSISKQCQRAVTPLQTLLSGSPVPIAHSIRHNGRLYNARWTR
ncbi:hypothetical protein BD779DRAFT_1180359 [Infundibulicybe gibba]|nr:hypothetical protein BD779DRAFT_1180359 [Infundibulicybe gibba]